ncbi:MAG: NAD(P)/FAD-dependent oxidoreductase [Longimicrobiales bacterium]
MNDILVIGGGPAGAVTALLLARAGWQVELVDRQRFPRPKPCGDCLSAAATPLLARLGLLERVLALRPARLRGWTLRARGGASFSGDFAGADPLAPDALAVSRSRLDATLLDAARETGVRVRTSVRTEHLLIEGRSVVGARGRSAPQGMPWSARARLTVGADGLRSVVARRLGCVGHAARVRKLSLTAHLDDVEGLEARGTMVVGDGWCVGVAPVTAAADAAASSAGAANVTVVLAGARAAGRVKRSPAAAFWATIQDAGLAGRLERARCAVTGAAAGAAGLHLLASGPFDRPVRRVAGAGSALVGDAAGYFDPFTGQGVYHALASAEILAEEADAALRRGVVDAATLRGYVARRAQLIGSALALQRGIEACVARPRLFRFAARRLASAPAVTASLIAATGGLLPPPRLLSPALALSFLLAVPASEVPA